MLQICLNKDGKDKLELITLNQLLHIIKCTPLEYKDLINQIKKIRNIDKNKFYKSLEMLPFFTFGIYNPPYMYKENFGCIHYIPVILNRNKKNYEKIKKLNEVLAAFETIEDDKIMVVFKLEKPIYDRSIYYEVYNEFVDRYFAINLGLDIYNIKKVELEYKFFLNHDKDLYFNEKCKGINADIFISKNSNLNLMFSQTKIEIENKIEKRNLNEEILELVKEKTGIIIKKYESKEYLKYYEKIKNKKDVIINRFNLEGIKEVVFKKIFRGEKIFLRDVENSWAELNIYITEKGFIILESLKKGMNKNLIDKAKIILKQELILK